MQPTLILVDGMAVLYRAFFAIRELSTADGRPTNAVFGFIRMLRQLQDSRKPSHMAVVFDGGLPEERMELLPEYKAQRAPMPDTLRPQVAVVEHYLELAGICQLREDGQEADDLIASVVAAREAEAEQILIASGDKDLFQLVTPAVHMISVSGELKEMSPADVQQKTGVEPAQIIEWLALVGDNADNIPGVRGVGPETAAKLLGAYGSLSGILENLDQVSGEKLREALRAQWSDVERNLDVVRLRRDLVVTAGWGDMEIQEPDAGALLSFFDDLEFRSMADALRQPTLF